MRYNPEGSHTEPCQYTITLDAHLQRVGEHELPILDGEQTNVAVLGSDDAVVQRLVDVERLYHFSSRYRDGVFELQ